MRKHRLKDKAFELSQCHFMFFDKLEKASFFLNNVERTKREPHDSRVVHELLRDPVTDGGDWSMFVAIVEKYGVVPRSAMPDSASAAASHRMTSTLQTMLREYASDIRRGAPYDKQEMLRAVFRPCASPWGGRRPSHVDVRAEARRSRRGAPDDATATRRARTATATRTRRGPRAGRRRVVVLLARRPLCRRAHAAGRPERAHELALPRRQPRPGRRVLRDARHCPSQQSVHAAYVVKLWATWTGARGRHASRARSPSSSAPRAAPSSPACRWSASLRRTA